MAQTGAQGKSDDNFTRKFDLEVSGSAKDLGELQYSVLLSVSENRFPDALELLEKYQDMKSSYPQYNRRTEHLFKHAAELINAIEAKKNFPNIHALAHSKQEEIHQKALENWEDLKLSLRRLRTIERDMALSDARSSVWVVKAILFSFIVIISVFVVNEAFRSFGKSFTMFLDETVKLFTSLFEI